MKSRLSILGLALFLALPALAFAQDKAGGNGNGGTNIWFAPRPVLIYTLSDATTASNGNGNNGSNGTSNLPVAALIVYNNGFVLSMGDFNATGSGGSGSGNNTVQSAWISTSQVGDLYRLLRRAGGLKISGAPRAGSSNGSLLRTVTIITDTGDSQHGLATTFSTFDTTGSSGRIFDAINNFMNTTFNGGSGGSGGTGGSGS